MASEDLKKFAITWILFGTLALCLIITALSLFENNNSNALTGKYKDLLNNTKDDLQIKIYDVDTQGKESFNTSSYTNPEISQLGSKDQVATAFNMMGSSTSMWNSAKSMIGIIIADNPIILVIFGSIILFTAIFLIVKFIRIGQ
jgi:hypothetical protein